MSFKQNTKEKSGLSRKHQTLFVCLRFCNRHCFGEAQKGWFVNTFVDCMIAKIIPAAAGRWAMHAASDPQQPNAADSAIGKKEKCEQTIVEEGLPKDGDVEHLIHLISFK